jgi:tetratricopeptide (TPR) repeat protein
MNVDSCHPGDDDDPVSVAFQDGIKLQTLARENSADLQLNLLAAKRFGEAGRLSQGRAENTKLLDGIRFQARIFAGYYYHVHHECLSHYHYEKHEIAPALQHHHRAVSILKEALTIAESGVKDMPQQVADHVSGQIKFWRYCLEGADIEEMSIRARAALDARDFMTAIDFYRRMVKRSVDHVKSASEFAPIYERVAEGNLHTTLANAAQAFAHHCLHAFGDWDETGDSGRLPAHASEEFLREMYSAYRYMKSAFRANPERADFLDDSDRIGQIITEFLTLNKQSWADWLDRYHNDPDFLMFMKKIDMKHFKQVERDRAIQSSKAVRLWQTGGFFVFAIVAIGTIVILLVRQTTQWWQLVVALAGIDTLFVLLGAFCLRTIDELSETSFMKLIDVAFRYQFKVVSAVAHSVTEWLTRRKLRNKQE